MDKQENNDNIIKEELNELDKNIKKENILNEADNITDKSVLISNSINYDSEKDYSSIDCKENDLKSNTNNIKNKKQKKNKRKFSSGEVILLIIMAFIVGTFINFKFIRFSKISKNEEKIEIDKYLSEFIKNYQYVVDNYYKQVDRNKLIDSAISGMMESLEDPYSTYLDEDSSRNFKITLDGSYKGIGIQMLKNQKTGYMLITNIFKDSPAEKSGVKVADEIISINNIETKDKTASEVSNLIKDLKKNEIPIKLLRDNEEIELNLKMETVTLNSVTSKSYTVDDKNVGYIYIGIFAENTGKQFKTELGKLEQQKIDTLIIDVRGNTGGHLTSLNEILNIFLTPKQIMYQFEQNKRQEKTYGKATKNKDYKIIMLCDESSASASEVLTAGIRENLNSIIIGKKTYGKGTVQNLVTLSDGTNYKFTIKKWLTPKGNWINDTKGIIPDIEVDLDEKYLETGLDSDDTQLQKALEYIKNN